MSKREFHCFFPLQHAKAVKRNYKEQNCNDGRLTNRSTDFKRIWWRWCSFPPCFPQSKVAAEPPAPRDKNAEYLWIILMCVNSGVILLSSLALCVSLPSVTRTQRPSGGICEAMQDPDGGALVPACLQRRRLQPCSCTYSRPPCLCFKAAAWLCWL